MTSLAVYDCLIFANFARELSDSWRCRPCDLLAEMDGNGFERDSYFAPGSQRGRDLLIQGQILVMTDLCAPNFLESGLILCVYVCVCVCMCA